VLITCQQVIRALSDYIDRDMSSRLRADMQEHFRDCKHCTAILDGARNILRLISDDRIFELPPSFSGKLYERLRDHTRGQDKN
jgi:hypothetical protein